MAHMTSNFIGLALSITTVALVIITIAIFITFGGNATFYMFVFAAIVVGFVNTWYISNEEKARAAGARCAPAPAPATGRAAARSPARRARNVRRARKAAGRKGRK